MNPQNPFTVEFYQDPYPVYRQMRDRELSNWLALPDDPGGGAWLFTRYDDVKEILRNAQAGSQDIKKLVPESQRTAFHYMLLYSDPPDHTRLRALISAPFSQAGVNGLSHMIERMADGLIADLRAREEVDFMAGFAEPFPVNVITQILGTPFEEASLLRNWTMALGLGFDSTVSEPGVRERGIQALAEMTDYFAELMRRPRHPPGSIIESLQQDVDAGRCSPQESMAQCMLLLLAGHETTLNLLGNGMYCLLSHPQELARLRQHPELVDSMINEVLRFEAPFQRATFRVTTRPLQLSSQQVQAGERISAVMSAANRDPAQFPEPDWFDIGRKPNRHLAFGLGIHRCLGEKLARAEARIAFQRLLQSFPNLELLEPQPRWKPRSLFRALQALPVRLG